MVQDITVIAFCICEGLWNFLATCTWFKAQSWIVHAEKSGRESVNRSVLSDSLQSHGLQLARLLCPWDSPGKNTGWVAIFYSRECSWPRDWTWVSYIAGEFFTIWATWKVHTLRSLVMWISSWVDPLPTQSFHLRMAECFLSHHYPVSNNVLLENLYCIYGRNID